MIESTIPAATFRQDGATFEAGFSLELDNHVDEVWAALTDPSVLPQWLAAGRIDLAVGGQVRLGSADPDLGIESEVTAVSAMRLLEYSWSRPGEPSRPIRWSLEPFGPATILTLSLRLPHGEDVAAAAAMWAARLDMLAAALAGAPSGFPSALFAAARAAYRLRVAATAMSPELLTLDRCQR